jgi:putative membrane protein
MFTKSQWSLIAINALVVVLFGTYYARALNYEFLAYAGTIVVVNTILYATLSRTRFPGYILWGIALWGLLHMMGGSVMTADGVLYAYRIYPFLDRGGDFYILKMDQVIHAFLYGIVGLMFLHLIRRFIGTTHPWFIAFLAVFAAAGFSVLNEIVEFLAAVNLPHTGVGGYENTVLDLIFNLTGALCAVLCATFFRRS